MTATPAPKAPSAGKAGRNLPLAITVGLLLGALCLVSILSVHWGWLVLATAAVLVGMWELREGLSAGNIVVPIVPVTLGALAMLPAAYLGGPAALMVAFGLTVVVVVCWRSVQGLQDAVRDIGGGAFVAAYAPFLASFTALMLAAPDGQLRVIAFIIITIASDIGGYAAGVLAGRHPMAPSVSPKKSWEGFGGSALGCAVAGGVSVPLLLGGPWWGGVIIGLVVVVLATLGDLTESMIKRDLGIKDMGSILPGHGGLMDRLDSLLLAAPAVWWLLMVFVPL